MYKLIKEVAREMFIQTLLLCQVTTENPPPYVLQSVGEILLSPDILIGLVDDKEVQR